MAETATMETPGIPDPDVTTLNTTTLASPSTPSRGGMLAPDRLDWDRQSREVAAARQHNVAARLAERQREAKRAARVAAWERGEAS